MCALSLAVTVRDRLEQRADRAFMSNREQCIGRHHSERWRQPHL